MKPALMALCATMTVSLASCSDDDEPNGGAPVAPQPESVFTAGVPAQAGGMTITRDSNGQVTEIKGNGKTVTFDYGNLTRANYDMVMTVKSDYYDDEPDVFYLQLNGMGFIKYALEVYSDDYETETDEWWFGYNAEGQLNYMKRSENEEVTNVTYAGGDITKVVTRDEDGDVYTTTIAYTNTTVTTPIVNKGCLMLFDDCFDIDMDEMDIAYYAGLLGKATKHLPVSNTDEEGYTNTFHWVLNDNQLPIALKDDSGYTQDTFVW